MLYFIILIINNNNNNKYSYNVPKSMRTLKITWFWLKFVVG